MKGGVQYTDIELTEAISKDIDWDKALYFIYLQYASTAQSFVMQQGGSAREAEAVFLEAVVAFITAVKKGKYKADIGVGNFLHTLVCHYWMYERKAAPLQPGGTEDMSAKMGIDIDELVSNMQQKKQVRDLVGKLHTPNQQLLMLFYYDNLSIREIIDHLPFEHEMVIRNKKYKCLEQLIGLMKNTPSVTARLNRTSQ